ncbi:hypothetical protein PHMEG_0004753 [Phytophthora megakarya]|uniref:PiggyBac transposable element-derived protein domain-containing protein n=1 Tax=Phytophthora megakarya TaxID=4795 RepID=A0A225WT34_9STRA|nr:hypothetical protein PHMEG_0004753 [Phytophthora megakarya]
MRNLEKVLPPLEKDDFLFTPLSNSLYNPYHPKFTASARYKPTNRAFPPALITKDSARPAGVARVNYGSGKIWPEVEDYVVVGLPTGPLSSGNSTLVQSCARHVPGGRKVTIPKKITTTGWAARTFKTNCVCSYSLQLAVCCRKYYKIIFLGPVDMATTNAFIVDREAQVIRGKSPAGQTGFLTVLHSQLLQTSTKDFIEEIVSPSTAMPTSESNAIPPEQRLTEFSNWVQIREGFQKRPHHQCEVCSIRKTRIDQRSATKFYCEACSDGDKRVYLCDRVRPGNYWNNTAICLPIWHLMY